MSNPKKSNHAGTDSVGLTLWVFALLGIFAALACLWCAFFAFFAFLIPTVEALPYFLKALIAPRLYIMEQIGGLL